MPEIEADLQSIETDARLCQRITEILIILTRAERQGRDLYMPLKQIEVDLNDLHDEPISNLYKRLMDDFRNGKADKAYWADDHFAFILLLCNLLNDIKTSKGSVNPTNKTPGLLVPA